MLNDLLEQAINELEHLDSGEEFLVRDLFKGYEWNRLKRNDRLRLGILFLNEIESNEALNVVKLDKTSSGQQKYRKR